MDIDLILAQRWQEAQNEPSPHERYKQKLLDTFPGEIPSGELFYPNTFDGSDEIDYLNCINIFKGKKWFEVDFNVLYKNYTQILWLADLGVIYYLPAFLLYFYNLQHLDLEYFSSLMFMLEEGFIVPKSSYLNVKIEHSLAPFKCLTKEQSKLIALFLVNVANLLPSDYFDVQQAQRALKNYWGKFLLMD